MARTIITISIIGLILVGAIFGTMYLWDGIQAYLIAPILNMPTIYITASLLGLLLVLHATRLTKKAARLRHQSSLLPIKAQLYHQLIQAIAYEPEEVPSARKAKEQVQTYHSLKAQLSVLASQPVIEALLSWEQIQPEDRDPSDLDLLLLAMRMDLGQRHSRIRQWPLTDLFPERHPIDAPDHPQRNPNFLSS